MLGAGIVVLAGVAVAVVALVTLHLLPTGLNPAHDAVSHYGITRYRLGYRVLTVAMGIAGAAAALGMRDAQVGRGLVLVPLGAFAITRLLISWFPMDEPGASRTAHGTRHVAFALVAFLGVTISATRLATNLRQADCWPGASRALEPFGWAVLIGLIVMIVSRRITTPRSWFGLGERVFYVTVLAWLGVVGSQLV